MQKIQDWYRTLKPRERVIVLAGGLIVVAVALYTLALAPFYKALHERSERVQRKEADLAWMRSVAGEVLTLGANQPIGSGPTGESLVVLVDRTARECGVGSALTGQTPNGDNGIRVRLEAAAFNVLVKCLGNLQQAHAISIEQATFDKASRPGLVNASLVLNRAPT
ncbi:MAG TPA: type II secretion system protein M [Povalibacter sp.]|uniref:type II secretion system protein M n=1 Tax=Povalibacter sp. TaxID=1962978 RepID=UPI002BF651F7|nr:type II secretion system protein M [Povalibacter sp.]HMN43292.1 type II secretion system protein M [Povalibacter sp.]